MKLNHLIAAAVLIAAPLAMAKGKQALIELNGDAPSAALATSWKKVADGKYEFTIDTAADIGDEKLTSDMVKTSLEKKLGDKGVKVESMGKTVLVTYTGDEATFLKNVSKTKIKGSKDVEIAMEASVSEGGIRANTADRPPVDGEVKAEVVSLTKGMLEVRVITASKKGTSAKLADGQKVKVKAKGDLKDLKKKDIVFFKPTAEKNGVWDATVTKN